MNFVYSSCNKDVDINSDYENNIHLSGGNIGTDWFL